MKRVEQILVTEYFDSANYFFKTDTSAYYFSIGHPQTMRGAKYHSSGNYFSVNKPYKEMDYELAYLQTNQFGHSYYMGGEFDQYIPIYGSIDAFRRFVPNLLSDENVVIQILNDTTINRRGENYHLRFVLHNRNLNEDGKIIDVSDKEDHMKFFYDIYISKKDKLPSLVKFRYSYMGKTNMSWTASTIAYHFDPPRPGNVWDLTSNPQNYITLSNDELVNGDQKRMNDFYIDKEAFDFRLPGIDGKHYGLSDFSDKLVLLEFFYEGCGYCKLSYPLLNELKASKNPNKFQVIGINFVNYGIERLRDYVDQAGIKFLVLNDTGQLALKYNVKGAPLFLLIKNDKILFAIEGYNNEQKQQLIKAVNKYI